MFLSAPDPPAREYLDLAYLGDPPEELGPEKDAELPKEFQIGSFLHMAVSARIE
jgi:hypothetical protein